MKILFFGDSITDAGRDRNVDHALSSYGHGYVKFIAGELLLEDPQGYEIYNRGISGNRIVDLYARVKADCWNLQPDVLSILIGVNDVWHELGSGNGVELERFEKIYRMLLEDTLKRLQNVKIVLCAPFVLEGTATQAQYKDFLQVYEYAQVVRKLADEYGFPCLELQERMTELASKSETKYYLADGVHPSVAGAKLIADEWLKLFEEKVR